MQTKGMAGDSAAGAEPRAGALQAAQADLRAGCGHGPCASFLTAQGWLHALSPLMDPNSNSSLFVSLAVGFHLDNEQSHAPHIAMVLMWGRPRHCSEKGGEAKAPLSEPAQDDFGSLGFQKFPKGYNYLCTAAVEALTFTPGIYSASPLL